MCVCVCTRPEILYPNSSEACGALLEGSNVGRDKEEDDLNENHCLHVENSSCVEYGHRVVERRWTCLRECHWRGWVMFSTAFWL